jgi:hypothetical protein
MDLRRAKSRPWRGSSARCRWALVTAASAALAACAAPPGPDPLIGAAAPEHVYAPAEDEPFEIGTQRFHFRSSPRVGLQHLLRVWAMADAGEWPPYAPTLYERDAWPALTGEDARIWAEAVEAFASTVDRSPVFDQALIALRSWATGERSREEVPDYLGPLIDAIERAMPVYMRHFWPSHDLRNKAFIASVLPAIEAVENDVAVHIERAYGGAWPDRPIPVEVVAYSNALGAYSTAGRVVITAGASGHQMPRAVEILFHEASHVDGLEEPLNREIAAAWREVGQGDPPERLWHDFIFYTTGEATRLAYAARGWDGYQHYGAYGLYRRGERWQTELPAFEAHWRPFMEGAARPGAGDPDEARRAALAAFARSVTSP